jgi:hypothetical protein
MIFLEFFYPLNDFIGHDKPHRKKCQMLDAMLFLFFADVPTDYDFQLTNIQHLINTSSIDYNHP